MCFFFGPVKNCIHNIIRKTMRILTNQKEEIFTMPTCYRNDRLNNLLFLSPSLCTKRSILFGQGNSTKLCLKRHQANSGVRSLGTNKHQLLHRIQSIQTFTNLQ
jgi:hypothetical protein